MHKALPFILFGILTSAHAEVRLPAIFSDHAVLQKTAQVPIWGWADPGEEVQVTLGEASATAKANEAGKWKTTLDLSKSPQGPLDLIVKGKNELKVTDVLVGEVWICSGQSNMEMKLSTTGAKEEISKANNTMLRHFKVERASGTAPAEDVKGQWVTATNPAVGEFTGVGYYFGKMLQSDLKVPVGLINISWGGSLAEAWTSPAAIAAVPEFKTRCEILAAAEKLTPNKTPSALYHGMLAPVIPYAIKGVIWYQGESNAGSGQAPFYARLLAAMVGDWRAHFQSGDFPFYICQLASNQARRPEPGLACPWAELREAQTHFQKTPKTGMAVLIDVGEEKTVHPINKKDPGERLARIALARDYGRKIADSGPTFESARFEGDKAILTFAHADGGLVARPLPAKYRPLESKPEEVPLVRNSPDSELEGFVICGEDRKWLWANAKIEGTSVIVSSPQVPKPVAVRYGWQNNPICHLYNKDGLPAGPFRTDNFPLTTLPAKSKPAAGNGEES